MFMFYYCTLRAFYQQLTSLWTAQVMDRLCNSYTWTRIKHLFFVLLEAPLLAVNMTLSVTLKWFDRILIDLKVLFYIPLYLFKHRRCSMRHSSYGISESVWIPNNKDWVTLVHVLKIAIMNRNVNKCTEKGNMLRVLWKKISY